MVFPSKHGDHRFWPIPKMFIHVPINFQQWSLPLETILGTFWSSNWAGWVTNVYRAAWHCWTSAPTEGGERRGSGLDISYDIKCTHTYCGIIIHIFAIYIVVFCYILYIYMSKHAKNTHECFESRCYPKKVQGQQLCFGWCSHQPSAKPLVTLQPSHKVVTSACRCLETPQICRPMDRPSLLDPNPAKREQTQLLW